jgi:hypothetical protein
MRQNHQKELSAKQWRLPTRASSASRGDKEGHKHPGNGDSDSNNFHYSTDPVRS